MFWLGAAALVYTYAGYPVLVWLVSVVRPKSVKKASIEPSVTVLITAYNEEGAIAAKLENTLALDYPKAKLEILVASDGSTDRTDEIVRSFADRGVLLFHHPGRVGKTATQNAAVEKATGEIIIFSDATTDYPSDTVRKMVRSFADSAVGCVAGRLIYSPKNDSGVGRGATRYWGYESFLKYSESLACSLIGASGCLYAVRRSAYQPMYTEACSDFLICTSLYAQGLRSVYEPEAVCTEETNSAADKELRMRVRVISQTFTDLWRNRTMMNPLRSGFYAVQLFSHKVMRYAVPLFLMLVAASSLSLASTSRFHFAIACAQLFAYSCALFGWLLEKLGLRAGPFAIPQYFVLTNIASVIGFYKFLSGERFASWEPIRERQEISTHLNSRISGVKKFEDVSYSELPSLRASLKLVQVGTSVDAVPTVSVIIPAFNCARVIGETLHSVFAQDYRSFEVVIVNDGSHDTEELKAALAPFMDRVVYAEQPNCGAAVARNAAIALARGEFIAFLDADDVWFEDYLSSQMAFIGERSFDMVYCDAILAGEPLYDGKRFTDSAPSSGEVTSVSLIDATCNVITSGTVLSKKVLESTGLFDPALHIMQDFDLWYRIAKSGARIGYQEKALLTYRVELSGLSGSSVERSHRNIEALEVIRDKYGLEGEEARAWKRQMEVFTAEYELEQGKYFLTQGRIEEARDHIAIANRHFGKAKISMMLLVLRLSPTFAAFLFRFLRPLEYRFIADKDLKTQASRQDAPSMKTQSAWLMFAKLVGFAFSFTLPLLVVRLLSQTDVGTYRQAFQLITNAAAILPLGFSMSAFFYLSRDDDKRAAAVFNIILFNLAVGLIALVVLALFPQTAALLFKNEALTALAPLIGAVIFVWIFSSFIEMVAVANQEPKTATMFIITAQFTKTLLMVGAVLMFSNVEAFLLAALVQGSVQTIVLLLYLNSRFPRFWTKFDARFFVEQMRYALPLGIAGLLFILQTDIHFYFVGTQFTAAEFAIYAYGCFQLPLVEMLAESVNSVMIPRMSKLQAEGDTSEIKRLMFLSIQKLSLFYFPLAAFLTVTANTFVITLFTRSYESAVPIFLVNLVLLPFQSISVDAITRAVPGMGRFLLVLRLAICGLLVFILFEEGKSYGLIGIIASVVGVLVVEKLILVAVIVSKLKMGWSDLIRLEGTARTAAVSIAAGTVTFAVDYLFTEKILRLVSLFMQETVGVAKVNVSDFVSGAAALTVCGAVFATIYGLGAFFLGLLDEDEKNAIWRILVRLRVVKLAQSEASVGIV